MDRGDYRHGCQCKQNHASFIKLQENQLNIFPFHSKNRRLIIFRSGNLLGSVFFPSDFSRLILHIVSYEVFECIKYYLLDERQFYK